LKAADTSVVVAAFASWHENHEVARRALDAGVRLVEHCALETYSVLTRLPPPHRVSGDVVRDFLSARFAGPWLRLKLASQREFVLSLPGHGLTGGAVYDALIAATASEHRAELLTCDRRASATYERLGARFTLI
jgi:predicted nucleic acid-binding protein